MRLTRRPAKSELARAAAMTAAAVTMLGLTACGSSTSSPTTDLGRALALVHSQGAKTTVDFGRPKTSLAANGGRQGSGPYSRVVGYGERNLAEYSMLLPKTLGFDPLSAEFAVTAGQPPKSGTLLSGLDTGSVRSHATALGASVDGSTYRLQPDYRIDYDDPLSQELQNASIGLNVISADGDDLRIASASAGLKLTSGGGDTLESNSAFTGVADCLDDPLGAVLSATLPPSANLPSGAKRPSRTTGVAAFGVGVSGKKGVSPVEHLCVSADSDDHASTIASSIRSAVKDGSSLEANEKWSSLLTDGTVTVSGRTVSLTAHPANGIGGLLLESLERGDLPGLAN